MTKAEKVQFVINTLQKLYPKIPMSNIPTIDV